MPLTGFPASSKWVFNIVIKQRHVSFMRDLRGADNLLQKAIEKVEDGRKPDTTQVVRHAVIVRSG